MRVCSAHVSPRVGYPGCTWCSVIASHFGKPFARPEIISDCRTAAGFIGRRLVFCLTDWEPQARGAEPQIMSKSRGERLLCGHWTATGLPPGHAAPRLFEELKAMGGAVRDLHLHFACSRSGYCLCSCDGCVSKDPLTSVSRILLKAVCQCRMLPESWKEKRLMFEYVCAYVCTWRVTQQALRVGLNTLCERTLTSFLRLWEKLFFDMGFSFGLDSGALTVPNNCPNVWSFLHCVSHQKATKVKLKEYPTGTI